MNESPSTIRNEMQCNAMRYSIDLNRIQNLQFQDNELLLLLLLLAMRQHRPIMYPNKEMSVPYNSSKLRTTQVLTIRQQFETLLAVLISETETETESIDASLHNN